jgi:hypothetical protein
MSCVVCKAQERDLNDIQQRMAELVISQKRAMSVAERDLHWARDQGARSSQGSV